MNTTSYVRPMKLMELILAAIKIWLKNIWKLTLINIPGALAIWAILYMISVNIFNAVVDIDFFNVTTTYESPPLDSVTLLGNMLGLVLAFTLLSFPVGATLVAASNAILGRPVKILESYRKTLNKNLIGKYFMNGVWVSIAMLVAALIGNLVSTPIWVLEQYHSLEFTESFANYPIMTRAADVAFNAVLFTALASTIRFLFVWLFKKTGFRNALLTSFKFSLKLGVLSAICFGIAFTIFVTPSINEAYANFPATFAMVTGGFLVLALLAFNVSFFNLHAAVLEKIGLRQALPRSQGIATDNWLRLYIPHNLAFTSFFTFAIIANSWDLTVEVFSAIFPIVFIFTSLGNVILTLFYYEFRARHENYGEELLAQELGYQPLQEMMSI